jgi:hypothetical protein
METEARLLMILVNIWENTLNRETLIKTLLHSKQLSVKLVREFNEKNLFPKSTNTKSPCIFHSIWSLFRRKVYPTYLSSHDLGD